jgi:hypothetical protein
VNARFLYRPLDELKVDVEKQIGQFNKDKLTLEGRAAKTHQVMQALEQEYNEIVG